MNINHDHSIDGLNLLNEASVFNHFPNLKSRWAFVFTSLSILFVLIAYVWFISCGSWTQWPTNTTDYAQLASAFGQGSLSLETKPSPALLALHNPYDPGERHSLKYPLDFSLYHGNYYLYFGPVPALFLLLIKFFGFDNIGDQYLAFAFTSGILIFQSLLIIKIWNRFFKNIPAWIIPLCILFCGLVSPIPWILTLARVYEAASTGGEFFFLAGLYFLFTALDRESISVGRFLVSGILWTLAIGSRLTLILPVGFVVLMLAFWSFRTYSQTKLFSIAVRPLISLTLPIILGLAILGWYNWARFNSVFETGFSYQLAGPFLQLYSHVLFSPIYLLPNLYNYLLVRPKIIKAFPYLKSGLGTGAGKFPFISLPRVYFANNLTGILLSTPIVVLAAIPMVSLFLRRKSMENQANQNHPTYFLKWLIISLAGSFFFGFAPLVMFFWVDARYTLDFMPSLILLCVVGFWQGYQFMTDKPSIRKLYVAAGIILMVISAILSILLALSENSLQFQQFNPVLWNHLIKLFPR